MRFGRVGLAVVVVTSLACSNLQSMMTPPAPPPAPVEVAEPAPAEPAPAAAAGGGGGNVAACKKYVEAVNAAPWPGTPALTAVSRPPKLVRMSLLRLRPMPAPGVL